MWAVSLHPLSPEAYLELWSLAGCLNSFGSRCLKFERKVFEILPAQLRQTWELSWINVNQRFSTGNPCLPTLWLGCMLGPGSFWIFLALKLDSILDTSRRNVALQVDSTFTWTKSSDLRVIQDLMGLSADKINNPSLVAVACCGRMTSISPEIHCSASPTPLPCA